MSNPTPKPVTPGRPSSNGKRAKAALYDRADLAALWEERQLG